MKIEVKNLFYKYDGNNYFSLDDINTIINEKEFIAIIGQTGSGKSTFIQNLNALIIPSKGEVHIDDFVIKNKGKIKNIKELRKKIGIVFQFPEYQLFEENIEKDILFGPKNFNIKCDDFKNLAINMLDLVGLNESFLDKSPFELSGGEKRKVAIAGILAFNPDVLILDEPTAGLDPKSANEMMDLFKKLNEQGKTIILVTHQMNHVLQYASRVLAFKDAKLLADDKPLNLFSNTNLIKELNLDVPDVVKLTLLVSQKYPDIKKYEIKSIDDFVNAYQEVSGK